MSARDGYGDHHFAFNLEDMDTAIASVCFKCDLHPRSCFQVPSISASTPGSGYCAINLVAHVGYLVLAS